MSDKQQSKVCMISLGCAKNLVDSEILIGGLKQESYEIVQKSDDADILFHEVLTAVCLQVIPLSSDINIKEFEAGANILIPSLDIVTSAHAFAPIFAIFQLYLSESLQQEPVIPAGVV